MSENMCNRQYVIMKRQGKLLKNIEFHVMFINVLVCIVISRKIVFLPFLTVIKLESGDHCIIITD